MAARGPVRLSTGVLTGLLLVRGDVELHGDVRIEGMLLVEGSLRMRDAATVDGAVQVAGDLTLSDRAALLAAPCTVARIWRDGVGARIGPVPLDAAPWALWGGLP
jgi:hypothetical protein